MISNVIKTQTNPSISKWSSSLSLPFPPHHHLAHHHLVPHHYPHHSLSSNCSIPPRSHHCYRIIADSLHKNHVHSENTSPDMSPAAFLCYLPPKLGTDSIFLGRLARCGHRILHIPAFRELGVCGDIQLVEYSCELGGSGPGMRLRLELGPELELRPVLGLGRVWESLRGQGL